MTLRYHILFLFLASFSLNCFSQTDSKGERLRHLVKQYGQAEVILPYTGSKNLDFLSENFSIGSVKDGNIHIFISTRTIDRFIIQDYDYVLNEEEPGLKGEITEKDIDQVMEWDSYPTYDQYVTIMQTFASTYPSLSRLDTIGTSIDGRLILALKISDNASVDEDEPEVFYSSTIHGNELAGFVLMLHFADYLLESYSVDNRIKNLADNLEIWINPNANPDGTYGNGNVVSAMRFNENGYDLNRNFPDPSQPYNSGNIKQKETAAMIDFMEEHRFVISANFHSGFEVVNYPWDIYESGANQWRDDTHADDLWFYGISREYE